MSIVRIKPGRGIWVKCDGTDEATCSEKRYTGNIVPKHNRAHWAKTEGWGRGLRSHTKTRDFCFLHMKHEEQVAAKAAADRAEWKKLKLERMEAKRKEREAAATARKEEKRLQAERKKALREDSKRQKERLAASRKPRRPKSSPSAASAPAPAT